MEPKNHFACNILDLLFMCIHMQLQTRL